MKVARKFGSDEEVFDVTKPELRALRHAEDYLVFIGRHHPNEHLRDAANEGAKTMAEVLKALSKGK